jgi:hypothetical protein
VLAAAVTVPAAAWQARPAPGRELVGVWRLVSYTRDGRTVPMTALLIITPRHFTRALMENDRPSFRAFDFRQLDALTAAQMRLIAETYPRSNFAAGTWRVEGTTFYFRSTSHHNPDAVGRESDRTFEVDGDQLRMRAKAGSGEVDERWERVERF